jgi:endonuclease/exonuclease/phosphatase family metal-dependent hydrolase
MQTLRVATWNINRRRPEGFPNVDRAAILAAVRALDAHLVALQEVETNEAAKIAEEVKTTLGQKWTSKDPATLEGAGSGTMATPSRDLLLSRLEVKEAQALSLLPDSGGEQRTALVGTIQVGRLPVTVAAARLSTDGNSSIKQLRMLQENLATWPAPRLLCGDLSLPSKALQAAWRRGWAEQEPHEPGGEAEPNRPDHILLSDPAQLLRPLAARVVADPVGAYGALMVDLEVAPP